MNHFFLLAPQSSLSACSNSSCVLLVITYLKKRSLRIRDMIRNLCPFYITSAKGKVGRARQVGGAGDAKPCAPGAAPAPADLSLCSGEDGWVLKEKLAGPALFSPDKAAGSVAVRSTVARLRFISRQTAHAGFGCKKLPSLC